jgi:type IV pilus assembly protein PilM
VKIPLFYRPKPTFGLDIGHSTIKLMQVDSGREKNHVLGYGYANFDPNAIADGEIVKPELLTDAIKPLMKQLIFGKLSTNRLCAAIPSRHAYTRLLSLPVMNIPDLAEAAKLEAEQYIPVPLDQLYIEYEPFGNISGSKQDTNQSVLMVAVPKRIIDSYLAWFESINLETALIETNLLSFSRLIKNIYKEQPPSIIIDFGAESCELAIHDQTIRLTSTIAFGGNHVTERISKILNTNTEKAHRVKVHYGIASSKWQKELAEGLQELLTGLATEIQKMMRYYRERTDKKVPIETIIITGGGANLPGLADFLSHLTGIPVSTCNPWEKLVLKSIQPPHVTERTLYNTAFGLALYNEEKND